MTSPLLGSLAATVNKALGFLFLDATLTRDVIPTSPAYDPADPPASVPVTFTCKAIRDHYSVGHRSGNLVAAKDVKVIILQGSLATTPLPLDRITITGMGGPFTIVAPGAGGMPAVSADPANATWECRANS